MEKQTQLETVKQKLLNEGYISRNWCLEHYFTRLGARINDLKNDGWNIVGEWVKTDYGKDYVYKLVEVPTLTLF